LSWAQDLKNTIIDWAYSVKEWIDDIRKGASWAVDKYEEIKDNVNEAKNQFQEWVDKVKDISEAINDVFSWSLQGTWNTLNTWSALE
jgi:uncharacterized protein YoxC